MKIIVGLARLFTGVLFIISGLIKANDPVGFGIKLEEYFTVFGTEIFIPLATGLAIFICVFEIVLGVALLLGYRIKLVLWLLLLMIVFFSFLTFYSAYFDKVTDCGCFGDAVKLTPWQSFGKDMILLVLILIIFTRADKIYPILVKNISASLVWLSLIASTLFGLYCYHYLPVKDFRPYKVGNNIPELMETPDGAPTDEYDIIWRYKVNGEEKEFRNEDAPWDIEGAEYVSRDEVLIKEGYKPPIHDFSITDLDNNDYTADFLEAEYSLFVITHKIDKARTESFEKVNELARWSTDNGVRVAGLAASPPMDIKAYNRVRNTPYEVFTADATTLKTIIRSNPGLVFLKKGTVVGKWPSSRLPSKEDLKALM